MPGIWVARFPDRIDFAAQRVNAVAQKDRFADVGAMVAQFERQFAGVVERGRQLGQPGGTLHGAVETW